MSVETLGHVIGVLALVAWLWELNRTFEQNFGEQPPFGSKRWHWPAFAFLGLLVIVSIILLRFVEDPR